MESMNTKSTTAGFTLIELLTVLVVIGILLAMSAGAFNKSTGAARLTSAGNNLASALVQAQQDAIAGSSDVEVRFYQPSGIDEPMSKWSILTVRENPDGTHRAVGSPLHLPNEVILNRSDSLSSLIGGMDLEIDAENLLTANSSARLSYTSFRFSSNGSTNLPVTSSGDTWHITLMDRRGGDGDSPSPPSNFFTIRVDPFTGAIRTFRP